MGIFSHILVPVDFTEKNSPALATAKTLALQNNARITLLHVVETIEYVVGEEVEGFYDRLKTSSRDRLHELAQPFRQEDVEVEGKTVMGKPARGIITFAVQSGVDLIVLSSHKVELSEAPKGWGTLSHQVSILCPCPVLLVK